MNTKFDKVTTILLLALMAASVGLLVYLLFFRDDKKERQAESDHLFDIKERELELRERELAWLKENKTAPATEPAPAGNKVVDLTPQKPEIQPNED